MTASQKTFIPRKGQDAEFQNVEVAGTLSIAGVDLTATPTELNKADGIPATAYHVVAEERTFTETTGAGTYTASVSVPAGATILDIIIQNIVLWTATTSAEMDVGDVADPNGWYAGIDLKATDLLALEGISFAQQGGVGGAYLPSGHIIGAYNASARVISGVVVTVGAAGNAGRARMIVVYVVPTATAATKA